MDSKSVEKVVNKGEVKLQYVYDIYKDKAIDLEFLSTEEESLKRSYPRLVAERGKNPDQFSDNYDDFEQMIEMGDSDSEDFLGGQEDTDD
jgi:hypothetical protein